MKIRLSYDEVRKICIRHLQETDRMPKELEPHLFPGVSPPSAWVTSVFDEHKQPSSHDLKDDLLEIEFKLKVVL